MIGRWWRELNRSSRSHLVVAALCFAFAIYSQYQVSDAYKRLDGNQASQQAVGYGMFYALVEEQGKAGKYEAERNIARQAVADLRYALGRKDAQLEQCDMTTDMVTAPTFTGELDLRRSEK